MYSLLFFFALNAVNAKPTIKFEIDEDLTTLASRAIKVAEAFKVPDVTKKLSALEQPMQLVATGYGVGPRHG